MLNSFSAPPADLQSEDRPGTTESYRVRAPRHADRSHLSEKDQQTVGASSNVTDALRRTHDLIANEVSRSEFAHQTLTESSAALKQLNESYGSLDTMLSSSRDLLGTLLRSQKSDTWYLQTSFYMLLATGAWLVFRRFLYGPAWWLVYLPLRLLFGLGTTAGSAVMSGSKGAESQQMGVGQQGASAEGLPDDTLPTIAVENVAVKGDSDTMGEILEKIIDEVEGQQQEMGDDPPRNTKKRQHEETFTARHGAEL